VQNSVLRQGYERQAKFQLKGKNSISFNFLVVALRFELKLILAFVCFTTKNWTEKN